MFCRVKRLVYISSFYKAKVREKTILLNSFFNREDLWKIFVFDKNGTSTSAGMGV
jgi:hypothetical protein